MTGAPNQSLLLPSRWQIVISRLANTVFYATHVTIPGISITVNEQPSPFNNIPVPGDRIYWEPLQITFIQDVSLAAWNDVFNWMTGLGRPENANQYANLAANSVVKGVATYGVRPPYSDLTVNQYSSKNNLIASWYFADAFPIQLDPIPMTYEESADTVLTAGVSFRYTYYSFAYSGST